MESIVVAIIGVISVIAGGIITVVVDMKRTKRQSDKLLDNVSAVDADTKEIKPKVGNIDENTKKIRDEVVEKLVPNLSTMSQMASQISAIHEDVRYHQRIKQELSTNVNNKDYFVDGIEKLYERNGQLESENHKLKHLLTQEKEKVRFLEKKLDQLRGEHTESHQQTNDYDEYLRPEHRL